MNKRAVEPIMIVFIIIGIIASLFVANQFFSTYNPFPTPTELNPNVNKWFYDTAVQQGTTWECNQSTSVSFRTSDLSYQSGYIEYSSSSCGSNLAKYNRGTGMSTTNCVGTLGSPIKTNLPKSWTAGSTTFNTHTGGGDGTLDLFDGGSYLAVCEDDLDGSGAIYYKYNSAGTTSSAISTDISKEISCGNAPIQDSGKFTCEGNNVVLKYCVYNSAVVFPSVIQDTCSAGLPCQFLFGQNVPTIGAKDIVKCSGDYKPNLNICSSSPANRLFKTNNLGFLNSPTGELCGVNNYNVCNGGTNGQCVNCKIGTSWCSDSKTPTDCTSGNALGLLVNRTACPGLSYCSTTGTSPDTIASCNSNFFNGQEQCDVATKTAQVFDSSIQNWKNKYSFGACKTDCIETGSGTSKIASCQNLCSSGVNYCEGAIGKLYKCNVSTAGNTKVFYNGNEANSRCLSDTCSDANNCASNYILNWEYCSGLDNKQRQKGVNSSLDVLTGGVTKQDLLVSPCTISCIQDNGNPQKTYCQQLANCVGKTDTNVCKDSVTVGTCNSVGDDYSSTQNCQSDNPRGFCNQPTSGPAFCDIALAECSGTYGCSETDGKIYTCDSNGYFTKTSILDSCNGLGCTGSSSVNAQCTDECSASGYGCLGGDLFTCTTRTANDIDGIQKIKGTSERCNQGTCNDAYSCSPTQSLGKRCVGKEIWEGVNDTSVPLDGNVKYSKIRTCNSSCQGSGTSTSCSPVRELGSYCQGNDLMEAINDSTQLENGGIRLQKIVTCNLECQEVNTTYAKCSNQCDGETECIGNEVRNCNLGVLGTKIFTCDSSDVLPTSCEEGTNLNAKCIDQCSLSNLYSCISGNSWICEKNSTTQQNVLRLYQSCGINQCGIDGLCKSTNKPNSFVCLGDNLEELHSTDANGIFSTLPIKICSVPNEQQRNGLNPYCSEGVGNCTYCQKDSYNCLSSQTNNSGIKFTCGNEITAEMINPIYCDAGCGKIGTNVYCDDLSISYGPTSFGIINTAGSSNNTLGDIKLLVTLTGSSSQYAIENAKISATLSGTTTGSVSNLITDSYGKQTIQFLSVPRGKYNITVSVEGYNVKQFDKTKTVYVTDSFIVSPADVQTIYLIPGFDPTVIIKAVNPNTNAIPDSLIISSYPNNLTTPSLTRLNTDNTKWIITFTGASSGKYTIGFKPTQSAVNLKDIPEQTIDFQIFKPTLSATLNTPKGITLGKHDYQVQISGQKYENGILKTGFIKPDSIKGTITFNSKTSDLSLLDQGGGAYLFNYNFVDAGTYSIKIDSTKVGYDSSSISQLVEASSSGTTAPPATDGSGNRTITGIGGTGTTTQISNQTWIIIIIVAIGVWLVARRKK